MRWRWFRYFSLGFPKANLEIPVQEFVWGVILGNTRMGKEYDVEKGRRSVKVSNPATWVTGARSQQNMCITATLSSRNIMQVIYVI